MSEKFRSTAKSLLLILCSLSLFACEDRTLVEDLDQRQSLQVLSALYASGIPAHGSKGTSGRASFNVYVRESDYPAAVELLNRQGLPETKSPDFAELTGGGGFLPPSPAVEVLRIDHARASELKEILGLLPGVARAGVIVRSGEATKVSIILRLRPGEGAIAEEEIRRLVMDALPGVPPEAVSIKASLESPFPAAGAGNPAAAGTPALPSSSLALSVASWFGVLLAAFAGAVIASMLGTRRGRSPGRGTQLGAPPKQPAARLGQGTRRLGIEGGDDAQEQ